MRLRPFIYGISLFSVSALVAENSGAYGAVGFQYSNMTKATSKTTRPQQQELQTQKNTIDLGKAPTIKPEGQ
ncbi:hypothetical protein NHP190002_05320 [Helicobacter ailurogastricus]|uniref:hypothetical protein n=1 Tax=Helicobacter ailurogastricus TaxID=1578720 RepID=UPI00244D844C|nr:hypothetical protein [Helicobacter ailurogastricus]GMB89853.1 hypothetical protein NHP190002_05320 [Helicobacter ailurogastricus]GMB91608.1 hypothetical protein NHP190009_07770 [Helicobacter ailurogastricus]